MRTAAKVRYLATTMGAAAVIAVAFGQNGAMPQRPPDGGTNEVLVSILIPSLPNAPFSAIVNTLWVRQLADGSAITLANHRAIARDTEGRIFQERRLLVPEDGKHESVVTQIEMSDPVAHQQYICVVSRTPDRRRGGWRSASCAGPHHRDRHCPRSTWDRRGRAGNHSL